MSRPRTNTKTPEAVETTLGVPVMPPSNACHVHQPLAVSWRHHSAPSKPWKNALTPFPEATAAAGPPASGGAPEAGSDGGGGTGGVGDAVGGGVLDGWVVPAGGAADSSRKPVYRSRFGVPAPGSVTTSGVACSPMAPATWSGERSGWSWSTRAAVPAT